MPPQTTRTLNPLPFQDLEPHRFEDLVRQLAYDLREWKSLEATGRTGADAGLDIRAIEVVRRVAAVEDSDEEEDDGILDERLWVFQCKREKTLTPKQVRGVIEESLRSLSTPPHGFVLAVACDVSKAARDVFRQELSARGVQEFALWARGELEDMLFQAKNDRLLFAYFGLSLQPRRRSLATTLRSHIARKKQLAGLLDEESVAGKPILLRDPTDDRYPQKPKEGDPPARWLAVMGITMRKPGHLVVLRHQHLAATTPNGDQWDAIRDYDEAETRVRGELSVLHAWDQEPDANSTAHQFWSEYIPDEDQAYLKVYRGVAIERVLAVDPLGDGFYPVPHIFVDFDAVDGPFTTWQMAFLERGFSGNGRLDLAPTRENRTQIFPDPLPDPNGSTPPGFDHSGKARSLSKATADKLNTLVAESEPSAPDPVIPTHSPDEQARESREKMRPFVEWRERVALPVLSAFAARLRARGHGARIVVRSVQRSVHRQEALESIELLIRLRPKDRYSYQPRGRVRVSLSDYRGWYLSSEPSPPAKDIMRQATQLTVEEMPCDQLEAVVLDVLQRLQQS